MKRSILFAALALLVTLPLRSLAQPTGPGGDPDKLAAPPVTGAPFDGGATLVIAAAIGYAAKKGRDKRKRKGAEKNAPQQAGEL